jgi:hypothetical protein
VIGGSPAEVAMGSGQKDIVVAVAGTPLGSSTELQRRMFEDAIASGWRSQCGATAPWWT